jgi:hypothetical protein
MKHRARGERRPEAWCGAVILPAPQRILCRCNCGCDQQSGGGRRGHRVLLAAGSRRDARGGARLSSPRLRCVYTGLRLGELGALRAADCSDEQVHVRHSKAGPARTVPAQPRAPSFLNRPRPARQAIRSCSSGRPVSSGRGFRSLARGGDSVPPAKSHHLRSSTTCASCGGRQSAAAPSPWNRDMDAVYAALDRLASPLEEWPVSGEQTEDFIFACAAVMFVQPARFERARHVLGGLPSSP